jgi:hypothetical protein
VSRALGRTHVEAHSTRVRGGCRTQRVSVAALWARHRRRAEPQARDFKSIAPVALAEPPKLLAERHGGLQALRGDGQWQPASRCCSSAARHRVGAKAAAAARAHKYVKYRGNLSTRFWREARARSWRRRALLIWRPPARGRAAVDAVLYGQSAETANAGASHARWRWRTPADSTSLEQWRRP